MSKIKYSRNKIGLVSGTRSFTKSSRNGCQLPQLFAVLSDILISRPGNSWKLGLSAGN